MEQQRIRIALVNQRYGLEVNGGSEYYTRQLAEHLKNIYDVEILTTKALDYDTWRDYYTQDIEVINGVTVRRFHVARVRNILGMKVSRRLGVLCPFFKKYWENSWIDAQGPYSPELIEYIENHSQDYTIFIFVTYLYYHTVRGLPAVSDHAVMIPTAHDEPYIYLNIFREIFKLPKAFIYLTLEEKEFVEALFPVREKLSCICGSGVELPKNIDNKRYRKKFGVDQDYFIYVGRIDPSKGCVEMFSIFQKYKEEHPGSKVKLVLMGKEMMDIPDNEDIIFQGFVPEEDKFDGISGARALWLPSQYESLSIAVLEALSLGVPVVVNGKCEVLKGHCERSYAGVYYEDEDEAMKCLDIMLSKDRIKKMSENAIKYVAENYQWDAIIKKIRDLFTDIQLLR